MTKPMTREEYENRQLMINNSYGNDQTNSHRLFDAIELNREVIESLLPSSSDCGHPLCLDEEDSANLLSELAKNEEKKCPDCGMMADHSHCETCNGTGKVPVFGKPRPDEMKKQADDIANHIEDLHDMVPVSHGQDDCKQGCMELEMGVGRGGNLKYIYCGCLMVRCPNCGNPLKAVRDDLSQIVCPWVLRCNHCGNYFNSREGQGLA